jgi:Lrp/AsnC family transcriptional regulator, leucine-responsive regulatory protein
MGEADLFAIVTMPSKSAYKVFTDHHFVGNANIKRFKTSAVMDRVKATTTYPV